MSRRLEPRIGSIRLENPLIRGAGDVIGRAAGRLKSFAEPPMRPGFWNDFVPAETVAAGE